MVWDDLKPSDILTPQSFDNAVTAVLALGGSTNAVVHLIAMARRAGVELTLDRFDELARKTPLLANIRPVGQVPDGGFLLCRRSAGDAGAPGRPGPPDSLTVNGLTLGDNIEGFKVFNDDVIRPLDNPLVASDSLAVLRGNLAPNGAVIKPPVGRAPSAPPFRQGRGVQRLQRHGGADRRSGPGRGRQFGARAAQRRPAGSAGHAGMGPVADPEEAAGAGCPRHAADFRRADERHQLRRLRAARRAGSPSSAARWRWSRTAT